MTVIWGVLALCIADGNGGAANVNIAVPRRAAG